MKFFSISSRYRFDCERAWSRAARSRSAFASAWRSAASNGRGSIRKRISPFFTGWPSRKFTSRICPPTRAFTATVEKGSTLPIACSRTGTVCCWTAATVTGTGGGPLPFEPLPSLARPSVTKYVASPAPTRTARSRPSMTKRRAVMGNGRLSARNALSGKQLRDRFAAAHQNGVFPGNQHFRGARAAVVVRAHRHRIGAARHEREQVTFRRGERALLGEEIRALAHRTDHVVNSAAGRGFLDRLHFVPCLIERRADEIVHGGVDHEEARLAVLDAGDEHAGVADDRAARIEDQRVRALAEGGEDPADERRRRLLRLVLVADADAAADVDVLQANAARFEPVHESEEPLGGGDERRGILQERADVAADTDHLEVGKRRGLLVETLGLGMRDAELRMAQPGGNVGMRPGVDIRVDAEGDARAPAQLPGDAFHPGKLGFRFEIDAADVLLQRETDLRFALSHAGKQRLARIAAGGDDARELP